MYKADVCKVEFDCTLLIRGRKGTEDEGVFLQVCLKTFVALPFSHFLSHDPPLSDKTKTKQ